MNILKNNYFLCFKCQNTVEDRTMSDLLLADNGSEGFTLVEAMVVGLIMALLVTLAVPAFSVLLPDYRLKRATLDVVSNLQFTKMRALRNNRHCALIFDTDSTVGSYQIVDYGEDGAWEGGDDIILKTVKLSDYDDTGKIRLGGGSAAHSATQQRAPAR